MKAVAWLGLAGWLALGPGACSSSGGGGDAGQDGALDGADGGEDGQDDGGGGPVCLRPGIYPKPVSFSAATEELGLGPDGLRMVGIMPVVVDLDGDRWPDLALTKASSEREDPAAPRGLYRLLRNTGGGGFEDWTWRSGLFVDRAGVQGRATSLLLFGDVDNDGDQDAFSGVSQSFDNALSLQDRSAIFLNQGDGTFVIGPAQPFTLGQYEPLASATFLDADHDGRLDLFSSLWYGRYGYLESMTQDYLWRGLGDGHFEDMTAAAGLTTVPFDQATAGDGKFHRASWGVTACDLDDDGWDDLLIAAYGRSWNQLYRNTGLGVFEDRTIGSGYEADGNENFRADDMFFACYCSIRPADPYCEGAPTPMINCTGLETAWWPGVNDQPWDLGGNSGTTACGDVDNDGDMDLLTSEIAHWHIGQASDKSELLYNDGFPAAPFRRPGNEATGLVRVHAGGWNEGDMGAALADLDNDGRLDAMIASSDYPDTYFLLWQQGTGGTFRELGQQAGVRVHRARGLGLIDYDRDGDYDLVIGTSLMRWSAGDTPPRPDDAYAYVFRNDTGQDSNKLMFHLVGAGGPAGANRDAVGARIRVSAGGKLFVRQVMSGHGLGQFQHDPLVIVGLGPECLAEEVTVRWPNATNSVQTLTDVHANQVVYLEEGQAPRLLSLEEYTRGE